MSEKILYKEDVASILRCPESTALLEMKRTGAAFKIGRRFAITDAALAMIMNYNRPAMQPAFMQHVEIR